MPSTNSIALISEKFNGPVRGKMVEPTSGTYFSTNQLVTYFNFTLQDESSEIVVTSYDQLSIETQKALKPGHI